ncbi:MAG TPA: hypothetical protein VFZ32_19600 [Micromonosporaceae bacterium]
MYRWIPAVLAALKGIEPYEVIQALSASRRLPVAGRAGRGVPVVGIFGRTRAGRLLVVVVRLVPDSFDQEIAAVRDATSEELAMFERWEANTDEQ